MIFALNALNGTITWNANVQGAPASPPIHPKADSARTMSHSRAIQSEQPRERRLPDLKNVAISPASLAASSAPSPELMAVAENTQKKPNIQILKLFFIPPTGRRI